MKKIGIVGGSFDPVHKGHTAIAEAASRALSLDFVIFIPAACSPFKEGTAASGEHRLNMLRLATSHRPDFLVSDYEIKKGGKSYTYETAEYLRKLYPGDRLYFILGDEAFCDIKKWKNYDKLSALLEFAVVTRKNCKEAAGAAHYINMKPVDVSSSEIRKMLCEGKNCSHKLNEKVLSYIIKNNLYKE